MSSTLVTGEVFIRLLATWLARNCDATTIPEKRMRLEGRGSLISVVAFTALIALPCACETIDGHVPEDRIVRLADVAVVVGAM